MVTDYNTQRWTESGPKYNLITNFFSVQMNVFRCNDISNYMAIAKKEKNRIYEVEQELKQIHKKIIAYNNSDCPENISYENHLNERHKKLLQEISNFLWGNNKVVKLR